MPQGDGTGPRGQGPKTGRGQSQGAGRGQGQDAGRGQGQDAGRGQGQGAGRGKGSGCGNGQGRGCGQGNRWCPIAQVQAFQVNSAAKIDMLKVEAGYIKNSLDAVNARIDELEKKKQHGRLD